MDMMHEAMKRRKEKGLSITISAAPAESGQEAQLEKSSDLAPTAHGVGSAGGVEHGAASPDINPGGQAIAAAEDTPEHGFGGRMNTLHGKAMARKAMLSKGK